MKSFVAFIVLLVLAAGDTRSVKQSDTGNSILDSQSDTGNSILDSQSDTGNSILDSSFDEDTPPKRQCPVKAIEDTQSTLLTIMWDKAYDCFKPSQLFLQQVDDAEDTDDFRKIFQNSCANLPTTLRCMDDVTSDTKVCLNATEVQVFNTVRDFALSGLDLCCADGGRRITTLFGDEMKAMTPDNQQRVLCCMDSVALGNYQQEVDFSAFTVRRYKGMVSFKNCYAATAKSQKINIDVGQSLLDDLLAKMTCISNETGETVLCKQLVN